MKLKMKIYLLVISLILKLTFELMFILKLTCVTLHARDTLLDGWYTLGCVV